MSRFRTSVVVVVLACVVFSVLVIQSGYQPAQAETALTPTVTPRARQYLPAIRGDSAGPMPTATEPPPTVTVSASLTPTATPSPTATTPPTDTPEPGRLAAPTLYDIVNADGDGNFTVGWSTSPDAEYYQLQQQRNGGAWQQIYEGPLQSLARNNLLPGQYCYRVRGLNAVTDSDWSASKCTQVQDPNTATPTNTPRPTSTATPKAITCRFDTVAKFDRTPGLSGHNMTYLHGPDLIVISGGTFEGLSDSCGPGAVNSSCTCTVEGICHGASGQIYVYDVRSGELHAAGKMDVNTNDKIALPLGDDRVLLTGSDRQSDFVITIAEVAGGYESSFETRTPRFSHVLSAITIDRNSALLIASVGDYYQATEFYAFIYNMADDTTNYIASFPAKYLGPQRMEPGSSRFLLSGWEGWAVIDIDSKTVSTYQAPALNECGSSWGEVCPRARGMDITPLGNYEVLLTNGEAQWEMTGEYDPTNAAFLADGSGRTTPLSNTVYHAMYRLNLVTREGHVLLINGIGRSYRPMVPSAPGAELYDPKTRKFTAVSQRVNMHALGSGLRLEDGRFLISGGYSDLFTEITPNYPYGTMLTTGESQFVELVTCK